MNLTLKPVCIGTDKCSALAFNSNSKMIAAAFDNGEIVIADILNGHEICRNADIGWVVAMDWLPGDLTLACITYDGMLKVVDAKTGKIQMEFHAHDKQGRCVKSLRNSGPQIVATGGNDGYLKVWNLSDGQQIADVFQDGDVRVIHESPDGTAMVVSLSNGEASHWDFTNQEDIMNFIDDCFIAENWIQIWSPDSQRYITTAGRKATVWSQENQTYMSPPENNICCFRIWDRTGRLIAEIDSDEPVSAVAWSPDSQKILYAHGERIAIVETTNFTIIHHITYPRPNPELTFMEIDFAWWNTSNSISASYGTKFGPEISVWYLDHPDKLYSIPFPNGLCRLVSSSDGKSIALGDEGGGVCIVTDAVESEVEQELRQGIFIQVGIPVLSHALIAAKEKGWRWFSNEPRAKRFLEEQDYDAIQEPFVSMAMIEPSMGIISKGMMKGIYLFDHGRDLAYRWVKEANVTPIEVHQSMTYDVAISYSSEDVINVRQMKDTFEQGGLKVFWIDVESEPSDPIWQLRFMDGVAVSYYFVPFVSRNYFKRYGSIAEYIECSDLVMTYWDSTFLTPLIAAHMDDKSVLKQAFDNPEIANIKIADANRDKLSAAQQLTEIFGFSGVNDLERLIKLLKSCVANSRAKKIVDIGFLYCMPGPIEWYCLNDIDGKKVCDLYVKSHMGDYYFRFFMYINNIRYFGSQRPVAEGAIAFKDESIGEIVQFLGLEIEK